MVVNLAPRSGGGDRTHRITLLHPNCPADSRYVTIDHGYATIDGDEATVSIRDSDRPTWEDETMEVVVSFDPNTISFAGTVIDIKTNQATLQNPVFTTDYTCTSDA